VKAHVQREGSVVILLALDALSATLAVSAESLDRLAEYEVDTVALGERVDGLWDVVLQFPSAAKATEFVKEGKEAALRRGVPMVVVETE